MSKFYDWTQRYGKVNEHNTLVPRDHWLEAWEKQAILAFYAEHPLEGYRRMTYMLMDAAVVAAIRLLDTLSVRVAVRCTEGPKKIAKVIQTVASIDFSLSK